MPGSPALDTGTNPTGLAVDQRGPGFARTVGPGTDIWAYEALYTPLGASGLFADVTAVGTTYTFTVTYSDMFGIAVGTLGPGDERVTGPNGHSALAALVGRDQTSDGTPRVATYRVTPPGGDWDGGDNGTYT